MAGRIPMLACVAAIDTPSSTIFAATGMLNLIAVEFVILFSGILVDRHATYVIIKRLDAEK